jgi:hypothetical protein
VHLANELIQPQAPVPAGASPRASFTSSLGTPHVHGLIASAPSQAHLSA